MAKKTINHGTTAGDKTGESLFAAFGKANDNFTELYGAKTEFVANAAALPGTGEAGKVYVAMDTGVMYRWGGSAYVALTFGVGTDANDNTVLVGGDGSGVLKGPMLDGIWFSTPSVFRLRLTGTGTVTIDARNSLGTITSAVASYTVSGATDQIEFPYAGDNAVAIRATLTGTATAEVI